ncbi:MAG: hypothetical protein K0V04_20050 [Deltaproteobacteria bacterium]|nr:hypothetical protein [Deltaproteobacteria bacterium]
MKIGNVLATVETERYAGVVSRDDGIGTIVERLHVAVLDDGTLEAAVTWRGVLLERWDGAQLWAAGRYLEWPGKPTGLTESERAQVLRAAGVVVTEPANGSDVRWEVA